MAKKKKKTKNADMQVWGDTRGDQKPETFFFLALSVKIILYLLHKLSIRMQYKNLCLNVHEDEQSILFETSRPQRLVSEPTLLTWLYPQVY